MSPHGYSLPLSPNGLSSMITPPPWHFAGEVIMVDYRVDPERAASFLPPGLTLGADPGAAAAVFAEWNWCSDDSAELAEPQRCQFAEFLIFIACEYQGRPLARCPYAWVDKSVPMMRGWVQGMPKQLGSIHQTRPKLVGRTGPTPGSGGRYDGTLSVNGRRVVEATVTSQDVLAEPPLLHNIPLVHTKTSPAWIDGEQPVSQLVTSRVDGVEFSPIRTGPASLRFHDMIDADFAGLAPVSVGAGYTFHYAETLHGGTLLT
ncbi:enduracididine biosynthesis enzyme MppR [Allokutzneria sp. A3M-2-11 16]|uniref:enduracididine biosynthesis enzyme MppR n=1 Tax=Allokutzneria sp. A3M-2-11 16 TaxID=2962043 RepID=UPI0020B7B011|nr:enduracididine biosynthesis enzyme MppR [Allokutzneria sp. A3M-2-11 16]MCP3802848.1 enduracididine biosynthesis enzyme MppR [Allokutzneria sp. A3M-2-11 16]